MRPWLRLSPRQNHLGVGAHLVHLDTFLRIDCKNRPWFFLELVSYLWGSGEPIYNNYSAQMLRHLTEEADGVFKRFGGTEHEASLPAISA